MGIECWENVIQPALHSIRSLLCTATNATPHERMFTHSRRSYNASSLPTWLSHPRPVLKKNHSRTNKYEPIIQEVELLEANPDYAHVRLPDGRKTSVSLRHLAPRGEIPTPSISNADFSNSKLYSPPSSHQNDELFKRHPEPSSSENHASPRPTTSELLKIVL